jgi:hypothetical protein
MRSLQICRAPAASARLRKCERERKSERERRPGDTDLEAELEKLLQCDHVRLTAARGNAALGGELRNLGRSARQDGVAKAETRVRGHNAEVFASNRQARAAVVLVRREALFPGLLHLPVAHRARPAHQNRPALQHRAAAFTKARARPGGAGEGEGAGAGAGAGAYELMPPALCCIGAANDGAKPVKVRWSYAMAEAMLPCAAGKQQRQNRGATETHSWELQNQKGASGQQHRQARVRWCSVG